MEIQLHSQRIFNHGIISAYVFLLAFLLAVCIVNISIELLGEGYAPSIEQYYYHLGTYYFILQGGGDRDSSGNQGDYTEHEIPNSKGIIESNSILRAILASNESAFDSLTEIFYKTAISQSSRGSTDTRQRLNLTEWNIQQTSWGGLYTEDRKLLSDLYFNASSIFEYGLGESTYVAAHTGVPRYAGVDSDVNWVAKARDKVDNMSGENFRFYFADIGPTLQWGKPADQNLAKIAYNYQIAPLVSELQPFDVYMVDGRYRVSCACVAFLHALKYAKTGERGVDHVRKHVKVAIHDATAREKSFGRYGQLQTVAEVIGRARELWVYRLKQGISEQDIYNLWKSNANIQFRNRRRLKEGVKNESSKFDHIQYEAYSRAIEAPNHLKDDARNTKAEEINDTFNIAGSNIFVKDTNFLKDLYSNSSSVFEFGVGKTSDIAMYTGISRYAGSDSKATFLSNARNLTTNSDLDHFRFFFSDIGRTNDDGKPLDGRNQKVWYDYALAPLVVESEAFDLYAIDGSRYGFLCFCISLLHAMKYHANMEEVTVLVYGNTFESEIGSFASIDTSNQAFGSYRLLPNKGEKDVISALILNGYMQPTFQMKA